MKLLFVVSCAAVLSTVYAPARADLMQRSPFQIGQTERTSVVQNSGVQRVTCYQEGRAMFNMTLSRVQTFNEGSAATLVVGDSTQGGRVTIVGDGSSLCVVE